MCDNKKEKEKLFPYCIFDANQAIDLYQTAKNKENGDLVYKHRKFSYKEFEASRELSRY